MFTLLGASTTEALLSLATLTSAPPNLDCDTGLGLRRRCNLVCATRRMFDDDCLHDIQLAVQTVA